MRKAEKQERQNLDPLEPLAKDSGAKVLEEENFWDFLTKATSELPAPLGVLYLPGLRRNAQQTLERVRASAPSLAGESVPTIRVGSKSIRCRKALDELLSLDGFEGVFSYTLRESLFLWEGGVDDVVLGYPSTDREAIRELCEREGAAEAITVMIDDPSQLDFIDSVCPPDRRPVIRVCLDMDMSLELPRPLPRIGVWRSPLRSGQQVRQLAELIASRKGWEIVGLLGYEAQIAGLADRPKNKARGAIIRALQGLSRQDVLERRGEAVELVRQLCSLKFVNGGGSGSVNSTAADPSITEITVGSALTAPHLFDHYGDFLPRPTTAFALDVVRIPSPGRATVLGGGWIASGVTGQDRYPLPVWPQGLSFEPLEGAGEVQTPLRTKTPLSVGDRVWFRHAKGGELAEHVNEYFVLTRDGVQDQWLTYRGEGKAFL